MEQAEKRSYEIGFMARDEAGVAVLVNALKSHGGEIVLEGPVEQVPLAYKIKKQAQAHFGYLHFTMDPAQTAVLSDVLERAEGVLRFLITTPPFIKQKPRPMMPPDAAWSSSSPRRAAEAAAQPEKKPAAPQLPLSNEALEKKIEEILQQS